ncbi:MAG: hypothetical protein JXX28_12485 [Deltaproteobacteria bacterium]|nr:hypothetical protein [Deltaproteobacteria bacterium]
MSRAILLLALLTAGCSEHGFYEVDYTHVMGDIAVSGRICDPDRHEWLEGAQVYTHLVDDSGMIYASVDTLTDTEGRFTLDKLVRDRSYTIFVQHGSRTLDMFSVQVEGSDLSLDDPVCGVEAGARVAVITGDYDDFPVVLDAVGLVDYELVNGQTGEELVQFLSDAAHLSDYDALFFPGGSLEEDVLYDSDGSAPAGQVDAVLGALTAFVEGGGTLVASDWSYDVVERLWPDPIDFLGDDTVPDAAQLGEVAQVEAEVVSGALEAALGGTAVELSYDFDAWPVMEFAGAETTVYLKGAAPYRVGMSPQVQNNAPMLVSFPVGSGTVWISSFRYSAQLDGPGLGVVQFVLERI